MFAIDLGLTTAAGARFGGDWNQLQSVYLWKTDPEKPRGPQAWEDMASAMLDDIKKDSWAAANLEIVFEWPEVYRQTHGFGKDLLELAAVGGAVVGALGDFVTFQRYDASDWTRSRPKGPNQKRILRHLGQVEEQTLADSIGENWEDIYHKVQSEQPGQLEHVIDAVGIGLYHLRRM